jgi:ATP-binding cassette, subfamily B, bacterial
MSDSRSVSTPHADRPVTKDIGQLSGIVRFLAPYKLWVLGALVALIVAASAVLAIGQALRRVVDLGFSPENAEYLDQYFLALLGVVTVLAFATFARFYLVSWIGERVVADVRKEVYNHVISLSPAFFETTPTGEILSRLTTDTTLIQTVIGSSASIALRNILIFMGGAVLLVITSPKLAGMVAIVVPLVVLPIVIFGRKVRVLSRESQDRVADVGARAGESIDAVRTVQAFGHEDEDRRIFGAKADSAFDIAVRRVRARGWLTAVVILFIFGAVDLVLWVGAKDVVANTMSGGQLAAFVYYAIMTASSVGALSEVWGDLQRAAGATGRLSELLQTDPIIAAPANPVALPTPARGEIEFDNVTFHYPARPTISAMEDFSLSIAPGETVAIVGPSGAGKSTVFQLLLRYYDPENGSLSMDGVRLPDADPGDVRARIGLVAQDPVIFAGDVWENIRYGKPAASDEEVRAAADAAQVSEFADRLPEGFNTQLGEKGVRLSGGQRQRLAIARAVLRNPAVLLLDEATSALDAESERLVQGALDKLMEGRTTLVIAHRLATIQKAGRIVVMEEGRIVASGRHDELLAQGGLYAHLAELQFGLSEASAAQ